MLPFSIEMHDSLESSNTFAKDLVRISANRDLSYRVIACKKQTKGRCVSSDLWISELGNIFISIIVPLGLRENLQSGQLSLSTGLGVTNMVAKYCDNVHIKWPNDVLILNKKVAGILVEIEGPYAIVGIGVNLISYPSSIPNTTSIRENCLHSDLLYEEAFKNVLESVSDAYETFAEKGFQAILPFIRNMCKHFGKYIKTKYGSGFFVDIGQFGEMIIENDGVKKAVYSSFV
jgi:BirA family biotin operon repressor/biotin-[acetyl-CoA-carboxylase] ligase